MSRQYVREPNSMIMASKIQTANGLLPARIVLRDVSKSGRPEYVTHREVFVKIEGNPGTDTEHGSEGPWGWEHSDYLNGNYHSDLKEAILDFAHRAANDLRGVSMEGLIEKPKSVTVAMILDEDGCIGQRIGATVSPLSTGDVDKLKLAVVTRAVEDQLPKGSQVLVERFDLVDTIKIPE